MGRKFFQRCSRKYFRHRTGNNISSFLWNIYLFHNLSGKRSRKSQFSSNLWNIFTFSRKIYASYGFRKDFLIHSRKIFGYFLQCTDCKKWMGNVDKHDRLSVENIFSQSDIFSTRALYCLKGWTCPLDSWTFTPFFLPRSHPQAPTRVLTHSLSEVGVRLHPSTSALSRSEDSGGKYALCIRSL